MPEAQLDRFMMKLYMGNLDAAQERQMLDRFIQAEPLAQIEAVTNAQEIATLQEDCSNIYVHNDLRDYMVNLVQATRKNDTGVSPRGTLALLRAAQGYAMVEGRDYVVPEDIKTVAIPVLAHRLVTDQDNDKTKSTRIQTLLNSVALPTEDWSRR